MSKQLNYNTDVVKHYVRYNGWLSTFKTILNRVNSDFNRGKRKSRCKYLTFCAVQAIDVFMLEMEKYVYRNPNTNRLVNVFFCENDEESFSVIKTMIGSEEQGFFGNFQDIILQNIEDIPSNPDDPFDEPDSLEDRQKIRLIEIKKSLINAFPFDVINLDFYGNFFPKSGNRYSESCQAYQHVLEYQKLKNEEEECSRFLMYLTVYTPVKEDQGQINPQAMRAFEGVLLSNLAYDKFKEAFLSRFEHLHPTNIDVYLKFILRFTKQILFKETYSLGWEPTLKDIFCYDRVHEKSAVPYKITTFIVEFQRNEQLDSTVDFAGAIPNLVESEYLKQLFKIVKDMPTHVPTEGQVPDEVKEHLSEVVQYRNNFLKEIGIFSPSLFT